MLEMIAKGAVVLAASEAYLSDISHTATEYLLTIQQQSIYSLHKENIEQINISFVYPDTFHFSNNLVLIYYNEEIIVLREV